MRKHLGHEAQALSMFIHEELREQPPGFFLIDPKVQQKGLWASAVATMGRARELHLCCDVLQVNLEESLLPFVIVIENDTKT
jgi:hypothetical protein